MMTARGKQVNVPETHAETINLELPLLEHGGFAATRIDTRLTPRQAKAMRLVFDGLVARKEQVRLVGLSPVRQQVDALRWILDRVADQAGL